MLNTSFTNENVEMFSHKCENYTTHQQNISRVISNELICLLL